MKRNLNAFTEHPYDLLVIGGGINGVCVAREAALRGMSVALVEKGDFGFATSANSLKIIHGGLRYLQHGDFRRMRASILERRNLMGIAPHLIHPLPVLIPVYGHGLLGKEVFSLSLWINDLVGFDRNRGVDPDHVLPKGRIISSDECLSILPDLREKGLTGGALFYDAQVYNSERFLMALLRSADRAGAAVGNYLRVTGFLTEGNRVTGAKVQDALGGNRFDIRARMTVNMAGPWVDEVLQLLDRDRAKTAVRFAKAINLITGQLIPTYAVGLRARGEFRDSDAWIDKGSRFLFITPWRGHSLIGTAYSVSGGEPDQFQVTEEDVLNFLKDINRAYPRGNLKLEDVRFVHGGLIPISDGHAVTGDVRLTKHHRIRDHRTDGWVGLMSVIGVKYTTARLVGEEVIDRVFSVWGRKPPQSVSASRPVFGGDMGHFAPFLQKAIQQFPEGLEEETIRELIFNYGTSYTQVLQYRDSSSREMDNSSLLKAEIAYGIEEEMAQKLSDVVFRRTDLGSAGHPGKERLEMCARTMGEKMGWSEERIRTESREVDRMFPGIER